MEGVEGERGGGVKGEEGKRERLMWGGKGSEWRVKEEEGVREEEEVEAGRKGRTEEEGVRGRGERGLIRSSHGRF